MLKTHPKRPDHPDCSSARRSGRDVVTICDEDPVLRLITIALRGARLDDESWLSEYFSPESVTVHELEAIRRRRGIVEVDVRTPGQARAHALRDEAHGEAVYGDKKPGDTKDLAHFSAGSNILISRRAHIDAAVLASSPDLRQINQLGSDPGGVDAAAVRRAGVRLNCVDRPTLAVTAEHAILLMLAAAKSIVEADQGVRRGAWDRDRVFPLNGVAYNWLGMSNLGGLYGRTIGLIGLGQVGLLVAERLRPFGAHVLYTKPHRLPEMREKQLGVHYVPMDELLRSSDIVSLHARWTPGTEKMMDSRAFSLFKKGAIFVNTSRGALVDEDALADALESCKLGFAALDTHAAEPRDRNSRLVGIRNTILTPHIAGGSRRGMMAEVDAMLDGILT